MLSKYEEFIANKSQYKSDDGFDPVFAPDWLYDFQQHLVEWATRKGRAAIFADCGMGKTPMQLAWAQNVVQKTNGRVLILTPLAVAHQTKKEADKFGIEAEVSRDGRFSQRVVVTNYEKLHLFSPADFRGVVCDESSILKNFNGARKSEITEFMRTLPYRLLCTATAAPNDFDELGTSSEALGGTGYQDMLSQFFRQQTKDDFLGWGRKKYELRSHAVTWFWRWVASWARAILKPSDYGFDDTRFKLPPLTTQQVVIPCSKPRQGMLFVLPAEGMDEQRDERRLTLKERCHKVAELVEAHDRSVIWCHLNPEGDLLEKLIPDSVQVSGSDSDDEKEIKLSAFSDGQVKRIITKPKIGAWGLNWQHCSHMTTFPSHSFEQYYQSVRRLWRFGQKRSVTVDVVTTPGEEMVLANLERKSAQADEMFAELLANMNRAIKLDTSHKFTEQEQLPAFLK
jgi:hypothetical protein